MEKQAFIAACMTEYMKDKPVNWHPGMAVAELLAAQHNAAENMGTISEETQDIKIHPDGNEVV